MRFPAVQGFEGPRGIVAITVPRAGYLTAALSARPPVLSPSWPPGITASAIELRPHGSARRPDRPCERGRSEERRVGKESRWGMSWDEGDREGRVSHVIAD